MFLAKFTCISGYSSKSSVLHQGFLIARIWLAISHSLKYICLFYYIDRHLYGRRVDRNLRRTNFD